MTTLEAEDLKLRDDAPLSRLPKGFEAVTDADLAAVLRMRNLVVRRPVKAERIRSASLVADILAFTDAVEPSLRFGWRAIDLGPTEQV